VTYPVAIGRGSLLAIEPILPRAIKVMIPNLAVNARRERR
jgi:phage tail protein X